MYKLRSRLRLRVRLRLWLMLKHRLTLWFNLDIPVKHDMSVNLSFRVCVCYLALGSGLVRSI